MRILIAHSFYRDPGGEDTYVRAQAELLEARHSIEVLGPRNDELSRGEALNRLVYSGKMRAQIEETIERFRPDVVHLHNAYPSLGPAVHMAIRRRRVPLVMTVHNLRLRCPNGLMFTEGELCRRCEGGMYIHAALHRCFPTRRQGVAYAGALWLHRFVLRSEREVSLFVAPSRFMASRLHEWGISIDKIKVVRNFVSAAPDPQRPPGEYGLFLGRLSSEKGVDVLLRALAAASNPPFRIAGSGPAAERLRDQALHLGLSKTRFLGLVAHGAVPELLAGSRYVVAPSIWEENLPLSVLEAMAAGRAVIGSRRGGLPELVEAARGIAVEPGDERGLAAAILKLSRDGVLCDTFGSAARRFADEELSPGTHLDKLDSVYHRVVGAPAP